MCHFVWHSRWIREFIFICFHSNKTDKCIFYANYLKWWHHSYIIHLHTESLATAMLRDCRNMFFFLFFCSFLFAATGWIEWVKNTNYLLKRKLLNRRLTSVNRKLLKNILRSMRKSNFQHFHIVYILMF